MSVELVVGAGAALLAAALVGYPYRRRLAARASEIERFAAALQKGDVDVRCRSVDTAARALNAMSDALQQRISALKSERDELATLLEAMTQGVLVTDPQQQVLRANAAAARLLGFPLPAEGRALWELVRDEVFLRASIEVMEQDSPRELQIGPVRDRHLAVTFDPFPPGGPRKLLIVLHDTTTSARYEELRREFVANVSHELRTPLTLIRGYVETLQDDRLADPARAREFLSVIHRNTLLLSNVVENLLDLSRLESPEGLPRRSRVDPGSLVRSVAELRRPAADQRRQSLEVEASQPLPAVLGDPDYLERAIANLLDNAIKYTPEGGRILVTAARRGSDILIEVKDTGIGIPEADLPRIFERFYRVDKSRSRAMGGTGLGLAIVKHVVQAHGGAVEVASEVGKGSTFRIVLPATSPA
jgi:two-component system phosphate regulon sensor histidine kinase PhoR